MNIRTALISLLIITSLASCNKRDQNIDSIKQTVKELHGKQISLPWEEMADNFSGSRSNCNTISAKEMKIVALIDANCYTCIEDIKRWNIFLEGVDTAAIGFVFLLYSSDQFMSLNRSQVDTTLNYPYFLDRDNKIFKKNKFPLDKQYQTFLVDEDSNILLVGNPNNNKMFNLYRDTIDKYFSKLNRSNVVKGTITTTDGLIMTTRFTTEPTYITEEGDTVSKERAREMHMSLEYIPHINNITGVVILKKR